MLHMLSYVASSFQVDPWYIGTVGLGTGGDGTHKGAMQTFECTMESWQILRALVTEEGIHCFERLRGSGGDPSGSTIFPQGSNIVT